MYGGNGISPTSSSSASGSTSSASSSTSNVSPAAVRSPTRTVGRPPAGQHLTDAAAACRDAAAPPTVAGRRSSASSSSTSACPPGVALQPQPCRDHLRLVQHEQVALAEECRAGRGRGDARGARRPSVDEQAGAVARLDRRLGDAVVGQLVVEVGDLHRREATAAPETDRPGTARGPGSLSRTGRGCRPPGGAGAGRCARTRRRARPGRAACGRSCPG